MRVMLPLLLIIGAVLFSTAGYADSEDAQKAFAEGTTLFNHKKYDEAASAFRRANQAHPNWKIYYNIGQSEAASHRFLEAIEAFEKYLAKGGDALTPKQRSDVEKVLVRLRGRQAFAEGAALFEAKKFDDAAQAFRRAYQINPNWKVLYNIAQSEAAAGRYGRAVEDFEQYLALGADNIDEERVREVEIELEKLQKRVGFVAVTAPSGAQIFVDGQERGTAPLAGRLIVVAGVAHELKVVKNGKALESRQIKVSSRQSISVALADEKGAKKNTPETAKSVVAENEHASSAKAHKNASVMDVQRDKKTRWKKIVTPASIGMMAAGGASFAAGLITGAVIIKRQNELECPNDQCGPDEWEDNNRINDMFVPGTVLFIAGASVATIGVALFIVSKKRFGKEKTVAVTPGVGPQMMGLALTGRF